MQKIQVRSLNLLLSKRTPLERCCVHNVLPFMSSSGLSPGSHEDKVQTAKVCLNCTKPSVARSSYWSLPVGWYAKVCLNCTKPSVARSSYWSLPVGRYLSNRMSLNDLDKLEQNSWNDLHIRFLGLITSSNVVKICVNNSNFTYIVCCL